MPSNSYVALVTEVEVLYPMNMAPEDAVVPEPPDEEAPAGTSFISVQAVPL